MGDRQAKDALFDAFAGAAKASGSGRRAEIVDAPARKRRGSPPAMIEKETTDVPADPRRR